MMLFFPNIKTFFKYWTPNSLKYLITILVLNSLKYSYLNIKGGYSDETTRWL